MLLVVINNRDPISDAPGARPIGVSLGAAVGGAAAGASAPVLAHSGFTGQQDLPHSIYS